MKAIVIAGDTATADVKEADNADQWTMVRQDGRWRIDNLVVRHP